MRRTATYFPLGEGALKDDIFAWLALSNTQGRPLPGKNQEWAEAAEKVILGMRDSLRNDSQLELA